MISRILCLSKVIIVVTNCTATTTTLCIFGSDYMPLMGSGGGGASYR